GAGLGGAHRVEDAAQPGTSVAAENPGVELDGLVSDRQALSLDTSAALLEDGGRAVGGGDRLGCWRADAVVGVHGDSQGADVHDPRVAQRNRRCPRIVPVRAAEHAERKDPVVAVGCESADGAQTAARAWGPYPGR